ncbi:MAG: RluA family pseudouridine synthase [Lachnospiraceae bacterium]|nr:RluA family pseudouridine synthase [Lachnospiraceae bacterium]
MEDLRIIIDDNYNKNIGVRIDRFLTDELSEYSRAYIQKLVDNNNILVNSKPVKANYKIKSGDIIDIDIPEPEIIEIVPQDIPIDIVYEDKDIIVIDKPKGMVVHPAPGHYEDTLVNALMYHCKDLSSINGVMRPGIVHRIDMNTSGLLVICKNDTAHRIMSEKFKVHDINRIYTAICNNHFKESEGTIDKPIARHRTDRKKMAIDERGRRAVTHYKLIENLKENTSLIECKLETGRTHQIRVHMASINHSLLGDEIYGTKSKKINLNGQTLHAGVLGFTHPITNEYMEFTSELPEYFKNLLKVLEP